jgi:hypothetical protein
MTLWCAHVAPAAQSCLFPWRFQTQPAQQARGKAGILKLNYVTRHGSECRVGVTSLECVRSCFVGRCRNRGKWPEPDSKENIRLKNCTFFKSDEPTGDWQSWQPFCCWRLHMRSVVQCCWFVWRTDGRTNEIIMQKIRFGTNTQLV